MLQQVEIVAVPTVVTEHRGLAYWCPHCREVHYAPLPEAVVKAGLFGPRLRDAWWELLGVIHRREKMTTAGFQKALEAAREQVMQVASTRVPDAKHARNLAKRFRENGEAYFRSIIPRASSRRTT